MSLIRPLKGFIKRNFLSAQATKKLPVADDTDASSTSETEDAEPQTKQAFDLLRLKEKNTTKLSWRFIQDRGLQTRIRIFVQGARFLHHDHVHMCRQMQRGSEGMIEWRADRSAGGSWRRTVKPLLEQTQNKTLWRNLGLRPNTSRPVSMDCEEQWFLDEIETVSMARVFNDCLAADMVWLEAMHVLSIPHKIPIVKHTNARRKTLGCQYMQRLAQAIAKAERNVRENPLRFQELKALLQRVHYLGEQFPRSCLCRGNRENWNPESAELQSVAVGMSDGSATTADNMEKTFGWVHEKIKLNSRSKKMANGTKMFYFNTTAYAADGGMPMLTTDSSDYFAAVPVLQKLRDELNDAFDMTKTPLPDWIPQPKAVFTRYVLIER
jgi:hypothetical protein